MGKRTSSLGFLILFFTLSSILIFSPLFDNAWAANTAPSVDAGDDAAIDESDTFTSSGSFTDPDADTWTATVDYGDGDGVEPLALVGFASNEKHDGADGIFDVGETVYLASGLTVSVGDTRLANAASQGFTDGSVVASGDGDVGTSLVGFASNEKHDGADGIFDVGETVYLASGLTVSVGDTRLANAASQGFTDGSVVASGDGDVGTSLVGKNFLLSHTYTLDAALTNGGSPFLVTVTINDGTEDSLDTMLVFVDNVLPTIAAIADDTINQGDTFEATGSFSDPDEDVWTAIIFWTNTESEEVILNSDKTFDLSHTFLNVGVFTVKLTIGDGSPSPIDDEGEPLPSSNQVTFTVTVNNVVPTLIPGTGDTIDEGDTFTTSGSFTDSGEDPWEVTVDYGDGSGSTIVGFKADKTFDLSHVYEDDGTFTVTVTVNDETVLVSGTFIVTVNNVAPVVDAGPGATIDEGDAFLSAGSFTDPGEDPWEVTVDYGDGTPVESLALNLDKTFSLEHTYTDDGVYTVTVTVDDGTTSATDTASVTVNNVVPTVTLGMSSVDNTRTFSRTGSFTDPGTDTWTATVDYGDGDGVEPLALVGFASNEKHDGADGIFDVGETVYLASGLTVSVGDTRLANAASQGFTDGSVVASGDGDVGTSLVGFASNEKHDGADGIFDVGETVYLASGLTVSVGDTRLANAASQGFTDGSVVASGDGDVGTSLVGKTFSLSHQYSANGVFDLDVIVTDDDGGTGSVSTTVGIFVSEEGPPPDLQAPQSVTSTKDNDATFITVDQDVWGGKRLDAKTALFRPQTWNESFADSSFITIAGKKLGAGINTSTKGNMEMYYKGGEIQGDVSVTYPGEITLTFPGVNSFLAGETVPLSGQWTLDNGGATMDAETLGDIKLLFRLKVDSKIIPDIRILDKSSGPNPVGINNVNFDTRNKDTGADTEIFSVKALGEGKDKVPAYVTKSLLLGTDFKVRPISVSPKTTNESVQPDTGTIIIQATNQFAEISLDLDSIATFFLSGLGLPSLGFTTPEVPPPPPSGNIFKYDIFDATNKIKFNAHQKLTFDTDVLIKLEFSKPVSGVTGSFVSTTTTGDGKISSVTYMAGEEIEITFPSDETDPITVTPTAFLDPVKTKIRNFAKIIVNSDVTMTALNVNAKLLSFEVTPTKIKLAIVPHFDNWHCHDRFLGACIDGEYHHRHFHPIGTIPGLEFKGLEFGFGPVWDSGPQGEITEEKIIINKVFSLGGFGVPVTLDSFLLDPEVPPTADADGPYEVDEGSIVLLDGSGSFDIDLPAQPLTHNWDLDDNGSFETNGESVDFIGIDGPAFFPITIEVCDPLNCDTDSSSVVVLNVAPTVSAGDDDTVDEGSLFTRVATFTDPGADTWEGTVDWGDGTPVEPITTISPPVGPALPGDFSVEHIYADNGVYTVTITITDDDAGVGVDTFDVTVSNVVPPVEAGTDQEYVIHDVTSLDPAEYSDAGFDCAVCNTQENFIATVNWDEGPVEPLVVTEVPGSPGVFTLGTASGTHIYRLPGEYTVTVTVTDDDGGSTSDTLVNTILGAQDLKNRAISFLSPFDDEKRVEKAIDAINDSLDSKLWINEAYLDEKQGHKVYSEERKAVKELQQLLKDGEKKGIDPALKEAAKDAIDLLVNSDRVLTITLMLDSSAATADKQNDQNKIDKENTTAEDEFSQGDASRDAGDFDNAIQHYRKAWEHAGLALKAAS